MACALSTPPLLSNNNNSTERQRDDDVTSDRPNGKQQRRFIPVTSAIPDIPHGFVLSLPPRPEQSGIIKESEQMIYVNHFSCQLKQNLNLYQYDVCVEQANRKPQNDQWHEVKGREKCKTFFYLLLNEKCLPSTNVWYDEGKCLYSTERFEPVIITTKQNVQLRFNIKAQSGMWNTQDIYDYINGRTSQYPFDAVRIIETLLKKSIHHLIHVEHNTCYFTNQKPSILDGGFEEYRGFVQMLNLAKERISLILQTKLTTFYPTVDMLEFIENYLGTITLRPSDYKQLANVLDGVKVSTIQSNHTQIYWIKRFGDVPGNIYLDDDLTRPNVTQYYAEEKGIKLKYPQLKCLEVYFLNEYTNPKFLPLEVCRLTPWQIYDHEVDSKQRRMTEAQRPKKSIPNPEERYKAIMSSLQTCNYNNKQNNLCQAIGFQINDQEMPKVKTRILPKPQITNGSQQRREQAEIRFGNIQLNGHLFQPKPIIKLSLVHFGQFNDAKKNLLTNFTNSFFGILKKFGMPHPQLKIWKLDDTQNEIEEFFVEQKRLNPDVIICVLESDIKASVKYCATVTHGLMTQCVSFHKLVEQSKRKTRMATTPVALFDNYCENLLRKINYKTNGINIQVNLKQALTKQHQQPINKQTPRIMFFGADVIHPTNCTERFPSIAALVGSGDQLCTMSASRICKQWPDDGKCSIECIVRLEDMVVELLDYNRQLNQGQLPTQIVFFRDGVDDGQYSKVINFEIPAIKNAFRAAYANENFTPLLTLIVVKKRHPTRFFMFDEPSQQTSNIPIGACIDTTIVHPYQLTYYLNSHQAQKGVNHPSLYVCLLNEIGLSIDELQLLTHYLCFTDPRSSAAEAIPSVVHQADLAALKARDLFVDNNNDERSTVSSGGNSKYYIPLENPTIQNIRTEILRVHEHLENQPYFG